MSIIYTDQEQQIVKLLYKNGKIERSDVMSLLGIRETRAKDLISDMVKRGIINREGKGKNSYYIFKQSDEQRFKLCFNNY